MSFVVFYKKEEDDDEDSFSNQIIANINKINNSEDVSWYKMDMNNNVNSNIAKEYEMQTLPVIMAWYYGKHIGTLQGIQIRQNPDYSLTINIKTKEEIERFIDDVKSLCK